MFAIRRCSSRILAPSSASTAAVSVRRHARALSFSYPSPRKLGDVVKLPLLEHTAPARVREIWHEFHQKKNNTIARSLGAPAFKRILENSKPCPMFVLPVYRAKTRGFFALVSQFQGNSCLVTSLEAFQAGSSSCPQIVLTFYDELLASKELGLLRADVTSPTLPEHEAANVVDTLLRFYTVDEHFAKVRQFNLRPREFDMDEHLRSFATRQ